MFPSLMSLHEGSVQTSALGGLPWEGILAGAHDPAERPHLERLARLTSEHPVRLRLVRGQVEVEAPLEWRAQHSDLYAEACLTLWKFGAEAVRKHLLPHLGGG
jgi:hypothetical protein